MPRRQTNIVAKSVVEALQRDQLASPCGPGRKREQSSIEKAAKQSGIGQSRFPCGWRSGCRRHFCSLLLCCTTIVPALRQIRDEGGRDDKFAPSLLARFKAIDWAFMVVGPSGCIRMNEFGDARVCHAYHGFGLPMFFPKSRTTPMPGSAYGIPSGLVPTGWSSIVASPSRFISAFSNWRSLSVTNEIAKSLLIEPAGASCRPAN